MLRGEPVIMRSKTLGKNQAHGSAKAPGLGNAQSAGMYMYTYMYISAGRYAGGPKLTLFKI